MHWLQRSGQSPLQPAVQPSKLQVTVNAELASVLCVGEQCLLEWANYAEHARVERTGLLQIWNMLVAAK